MSILLPWQCTQAEGLEHERHLVVTGGTGAQFLVSGRA